MADARAEATAVLSLAWPLEVAVALAREQLGRGRALRVLTRGHSMWPSVRDGAVVTVLPLLGAPRVGDLVLVATPTRLVLHRVIACDTRGIVTKGDAAPHDDGRVPREAILGRLPARWDDPLRAVVSRYAGRPGATAVGILRRWLTG